MHVGKQPLRAFSARLTAHPTQGGRDGRFQIPDRGRARRACPRLSEHHSGMEEPGQGAPSDEDQRPRHLRAGRCRLLACRERRRSDNRPLTHTGGDDRTQRSEPRHDARRTPRAHPVRHLCQNPPAHRRPSQMGTRGTPDADAEHHSLPGTRRRFLRERRRVGDQPHGGAPRPRHALHHADSSPPPPRTRCARPPRRGVATRHRRPHLSTHAPATSRSTSPREREPQRWGEIGRGTLRSPVDDAAQPSHRRHGPAPANAPARIASRSSASTGKSSCADQPSRPR